MGEHDWMAGRTIEEIKKKMSTTTQEEEEIEREVKKKHKVAQLNMIQVTQEQAKDNIITWAQEKSNNLIKVQKILLTCFKFLTKLKSNIAPPESSVSGGGSSENGESKSENPESKNPELKNLVETLYWTPFQRRRYLSKLAKKHEIPSKLENKVGKAKDESVVIKFLVDEKILPPIL